MKNIIKDFAKQFAFEPTIENKDKLTAHEKFVVVGMGGSHLAADLVQTWDPETDIVIHRSYGLPQRKDTELKSRLMILSSYSGNTEEVLDAYDEAGKRGYDRAVISIGGKLLERAKEDGVPYVEMPDTGIQPRLALGFSFKGLLKLMGRDDAVQEIGGLADTLKPDEYEAEGKKLADMLRDHVPVIYASETNGPIAYNWKIKLNETGKIPAFYNVLPELNHNEMNGFDVQETTKKLSENVYFIFLKDESDDPRIVKRMEILEKLYRDRGLPVRVIELTGSVFHKLFFSLVIADWTAYYTAENYGLEAEQVPMVEEFKRLIA